MNTAPRGESPPSPAETALTKRERQVLGILASQPRQEITVQQIARALASRYAVRASPDSIHRTAVALQRRGLVLMYGAARIVRTYQITATGSAQ